MAARMVALEKCPRVRTVGIKDVCRRLFVNLFLQASGAHAKEACRNLNLCADLNPGIEGDIYAVREWEELGRGETRTQRRERQETADQMRVREELVRKRKMRARGRTL